MNNHFTIAGKITVPYGILGWMHFLSFTENKKNIFFYQPWFIKTKHQYVDISIESWKKHNKKFIIKIKNINDRNQAFFFQKKEIYVQNNCFPLLTNDEYYYKDIIKCNVYDEFSIYIGEVINIVNNKFYDLLIIKNKQSKQIYIPFIYKKIIKKVNIDKKEIIIKINYN
ncbi:16S rRNA processing protein RimM [Buchnera aphidicola (Thelaxes californica)]|uniref:Ribosome maturation factor RimM n=1 Tax=Buchnera aphidicola (Thelaxes californica) TaxID=1315998 RepID=A0A4D6YFG1_9GAMM|nr:ribosome maturation factor RimM [Buchnera aphidicola]QCI26833.1 16S rRNA processing protein RimM [Buchnera aphidicola (Thelaxes californica)]